MSKNKTRYIDKNGDLFCEKHAPEDAEIEQFYIEDDDIQHCSVCSCDLETILLEK